MIVRHRRSALNFRQSRVIRLSIRARWDRRRRLARREWAEKEGARGGGRAMGDMFEVLFWLFMLLLLAAAVFAGALFLRGQLPVLSSTGAIFGPRPEKRLDIVEQSNLDGRRRLVLIRRDDIEHLIMTGGPVDVVIETNIEPRRHRGAKAADSPTSPRSPRPMSGNDSAARDQ